MNEVRAGLGAVKNDLARLTEDFEEHRNQTSTEHEQLTHICAKIDAIDSRLVSVSANINLTAMESQVEEHSNHVSCKLAVLQNKQDAIDSKLDLLHRVKTR